MRTDDDLRLWLSVEAIVGDSEIELDDLDDGDPVLAAHEPSERELDAMAATVDQRALAAQRADVDELIRETWQRARTARAERRGPRRATLSPDLPRADLLAMVQQLQAAHPHQFAQHYRNLDEMSDATLRALVEDMLALVDDAAE